MSSTARNETLVPSEPRWPLEPGDDRDPPPFFDRRPLRMRFAGERGWLAGLRIRKKLILLHSFFSLTLALVLVLTIRSALGQLITAAELSRARTMLAQLAPTLVSKAASDVRLPADQDHGVLHSGSPSRLGLDPQSVTRAAASPGLVVAGESASLGACALLYVPARGGAPERYHAVVSRIPEARAAVSRLYLIVAAALIGVYALVAVALEMFVLPQAVWRPIRRTLAADRAVQEGRREGEIIDDSIIPDDELGEIMRSRNRTVRELRRQESALNDAMARLESLANDLARKNHVLEAARRTIADTDRLASLGMMSAGIAHELNTPLSVLKGLVEKLNMDPASVDPAQARLMLRVVGRLERLGEGLLDFARVRPPCSTMVSVRGIVRDAADLVRLDREAAGVEIINNVPEQAQAECDADRMVQVFVNLLRNAVDAVSAGRVTRSPSPPPALFGGVDAPRAGHVEVGIERRSKDGRDWISLSVTDDGPGIDPGVLERLFEPFTSTRLDARGTGLGLAVAEGIVREHAGLLLARNRTDHTGAVFEILLPVRQGSAVASESPQEPWR